MMMTRDMKIGRKVQWKQTKQNTIKCDRYNGYV